MLYDKHYTLAITVLQLVDEYSSKRLIVLKKPWLITKLETAILMLLAQ